MKMPRVTAGLLRRTPMGCVEKHLATAACRLAIWIAAMPVEVGRKGGGKGEACSTEWGRPTL